MCIESRASSDFANVNNDVVIDKSLMFTRLFEWQSNVAELSFDTVNFASDCSDDLYYEVDYSYILDVDSDVGVRFRYSHLDGVLDDGNHIDLGSFEWSDSLNSYSNVHEFTYSGKFIAKGHELVDMPLIFYFTLIGEVNSRVNLDFTLDLDVKSVVPLSNTESQDYEAGYNTGYSDGVLDGVMSVDKEAISNEAYQAGYEAGFSDGSDDTLKEDKTLIDTFTDEFTLTGQVINNYAQQYIIEPTLSIANGSLNYTMPVSFGSLFDVGKDYLVDFKKISVVNSNAKVDVELGEYVSHRISNLPAFTLSGPGLSMSSRGELIYSPDQTGDFNIRVSVPAELVLRSTYNEPIENDYAGVYVPSSGYALGELKWDSTFTYEIDVYEIDIVEEIDYLRDQSNKLSDLNNTQQESLDTMKETQETTKGIFSSLQDFFGSFFQNLIDSVIGLFVPSAEEMSGLFDQLNQFFSDRFGFLYAPFDYMIQLLDVFITSTGDTGLTFPGFSIMGYEVWPDMTYDISKDPLVGQIFQYVRMGTGILLAGWFVMYLQDFFKERFSQG